MALLARVGPGTSRRWYASSSSFISSKLEQMHVVVLTALDTTLDIFLDGALCIFRVENKETV